MSEFTTIGKEILRPADYSKGTADLIAASITEMAKEGDVLEALAQITCLKKALDSARSQIMDVAIEEAEKHNGEFTRHGATFKVKETGVRYKFDTCNDTIWRDLNDQFQKVQAALKERENQLKGIKRQQEFVNDDGEVLGTIYPPQRKSTTVVEITLAKGQDDG